MSDQKRSDRIGALWKKTKGDNTFYTGQINIDGQTINIVLFKNTNKTSPNHPDWNILKSNFEAKASTPKPTPAATGQGRTRRTAPQQTQEPEDSQPVL